MAGRKIGTLGAAALLACATALAGPALAQDPITITYVGAFTANEWHTEIKAGAEQAVKDLGFPVELRVVGPTDFDPVQQAQIFTREAVTQPDAMIVTNVASALFVQPAMDAKAQGITVVWTNSAPTREFDEDLFVASDPKELGFATAQALADHLSQKMGQPADQIEGTVVVGLCVPGLMVLENRIAGLRAGLNDLMPKLTVSPTIETKPDRSGSFVAWNQAIAANRDALAYADACEAGQQNIAKIIEDDGLSGVTVVFDAPEEIRDAIQRGYVLVAAPTNHYLQAYIAVTLTAQALHDGKPLPAGWVKLPTNIIDSGNIGQMIAAWEDPSAGLRAFFDADVAAISSDVAEGRIASTADYDLPPQ